jgi:NitT/TauT family transport system ATP-binding protein
MNSSGSASSGFEGASVSLTDVRKVFVSGKSAVEALLPVTIDIKAGETTAIVGPSGCGKSTILKIIAGIEKPTSGSVVLRLEQAKRQPAGIVFQRDFLLEWRDVIANVILPAEIQKLDLTAARERAHELVRELGLGGFERKLPWQLSGGMRQRVAIARAMLTRPPLMLLDEPFSALDAMTRDQMNELLQHVQQTEATTYLLITHSIAEAVYMSDRVFVMSGRPGQVLDQVEVDFPRPRSLAIRETPEFSTIARRIRLQLERPRAQAA